MLTAATARSETVTVRHVLDGDSFVLADGRHARLIGINAPEFGKDGAPNQPLARQARDRLAGMIKGRPVVLGFEAERHDRYERLLAHVALADGTGVEEVLLREGLAWMIAIPPNVDRLDTLRRAENEARSARRGVWREPAYAPKPADKLTRRDTGFQLIEGRIMRTGQGRKMIYFDLAPNVSLAVPREDWKKYFTGKPAEWVGRQVVARGWLTEKRDRDVAVAEPRTPSRDRLRLRVAHPAMLTWHD